MGYSLTWIKLLQEGNTISFRPHGQSMKPKIKSGQLCTVAPIDFEKLEVGDVVYCKVKGRQFLHLVSAIDNDTRYQISNNHGYVNGWIGRNSIFGKLVRVED